MVSYLLLEDSGIYGPGPQTRRQEGAPALSEKMTEQIHDRMSLTPMSSQEKDLADMPLGFSMSANTWE